jgi:hypothetical protein
MHADCYTSKPRDRRRHWQKARLLTSIGTVGYLINEIFDERIEALHFRKSLPYHRRLSRVRKTVRSWSGEIDG